MVVKGRVRGSVFYDGTHSIVRTNHRELERTIKKLNSNKALQSVVTTGTIKRAKDIIKEVNGNGTKYGL